MGVPVHRMPQSRVRPAERRSDSRLSVSGSNSPSPAIRVLAASRHSGHSSAAPSSLALRHPVASLRCTALQPRRPWNHIAGSPGALAALYLQARVREAHGHGTLTARHHDRAALLQR